MQRCVILKRAASILLTTVLCFSTVAVADTGGTDFFEELEPRIEELRNFANSEQEEQLLLVESAYAVIREKAVTESPWNEAVITGGTGFSPLLTPEIKADLGFQRYVYLGHLRGKNITIVWSGAPNAGLNARLAQFVEDNNGLDEEYNLDGLSMKEASSRFTELANRLQELYAEFQSIKSEAEPLGGTVDIRDGSTPVEDLTEPSQLHTAMAERIAKLLKDLNGLVFSTKDTWEENYSSLLDSENKKLIGALFGSEMAEALSQDNVNTTIKNYLTSDRALREISERQVQLFSGPRENAIEALYSMITAIADGLLDEPVMAGVKNALISAGWDAANFIKVNKYIADAVDTQKKSRIINLNMILGRFTGIFKNDVLSDVPVLVDTKTLSSTEYNIKIHKSGSQFVASVINVVDTLIFNSDGTEDPDVSTKNDMGELEFVIKNHKSGDFLLKVYRADGNHDIFSFLNEFAVTIYDTAVPVTGVNIRDGSEISVKVGSTRQLNLQIIPVNATNKAVVWKSANEAVATVSKTGLVKGISSGNTTISVETVDGGFVASIKVYVSRDSGTQGSTSGTGTVSTGSGGAVNVDGITVSMGSGTVPAQINLRAVLETGYAPPQNMGLASQIFSVSYSPNVPLLQPMELKINLESYDESKRYFVYKYDESSNQWMPLESAVSADKKSITAKSSETGVFAVFASDAVFNDLVGHWSEANIMYLYGKGIISGYTPTEFMPDRQITRAEFAAIVCRMTGINTDEGTASYSDAVGHWAENVIAAATRHGYMVGYDDGTFKPDAAMTREQIIAVLLRAKYLGEGFDGSGQELIERIVQNTGVDLSAVNVGFSDFDQTSEWARDYIKAAYALNFVSGYSDGTIRPQALGTRSEAIVLAMRILKP